MADRAHYLISRLASGAAIRLLIRSSGWVGSLSCHGTHFRKKEKKTELPTLPLIPKSISPILLLSLLFLVCALRFSRVLVVCVRFPYTDLSCAATSLLSLLAFAVGTCITVPCDSVVPRAGHNLRAITIASWSIGSIQRYGIRGVGCLPLRLSRSNSMFQPTSASRTS